MDIVVDIQCLKDGNDIATPKEIGIVALDGNFISHWMISPKNSKIDTLSIEVRKENNWLAKKHHGLDYFDGETEKKAVYKTLRDLTRRVGKIYVRGKEKWQILNKVTAREVINLEYDPECPSFDKLPWSDNFCLQHGVKSPHLQYICALNNAYRIKAWLSTAREKYKRTESHQAFQPPLNLCDEKPGDFEDFVPHPISYCGSVPSRPNPSEVDETDGICSEH
jgi:hypothetical protein